MRVFGIDVGTAIVGWGVVESSNKLANKLAYVDHGVIKTSKTDSDEQRLSEIYEQLQDLLKRYQPDEVAVESLFYFKNQKTVMTVSQARGVILLAVHQLQLKLTGYTPLQAKTAVTGYGRADKVQMQNMVKAILSLSEVPNPDDAADALAMAIAHINRMGMNDKLRLT